MLQKLLRQIRQHPLAALVGSTSASTIIAIAIAVSYSVKQFGESASPPLVPIDVTPSQAELDQIKSSVQSALLNFFVVEKRVM